MQDVAGKVAFITGGASGIGLAMARTFAAAGMKVAVADIQVSALAAVTTEFADSNSELITMQVDVTDRTAMEQAAEDTIKAFGKVHVVCNNAGVVVSGNIIDMSYSDWDWVMKVNLDGVINGVVTFVNRIKSHGEGGYFVNTASMAGQFGIADLGVYNTAKFGVVGMSEAMRQDLAKFNIGTSVLCPGFVATNIYTSERNRPVHLGKSAGPAIPMPSANDDPERANRMQQMIAGTIDPSIIGDMVLYAIQNDIFYILSHSEFKQTIENRSEEIRSNFDLWAEWRLDQEN